MDAGPADVVVREVSSPSWSLARTAAAGPATLCAHAQPPIASDVPPKIVVTYGRMPERSQRAVVVTDVIDERSIVQSGARDAGEALEQPPVLTRDHKRRA